MNRLTLVRRRATDHGKQTSAFGKPLQQIFYGCLVLLGSILVSASFLVFTCARPDRLRDLILDSYREYEAAVEAAGA